MLNTKVGPVHFEDFGGTEFERLVFAYHLRAGWTDLAWYGKTGSDQGRDIIGNEILEDGSQRRTVIQCANRDVLTLDKAKHDMTGAVGEEGDHLKAFKFVCRGDVSAARRRAIQEAGKKLKLEPVTIWSGSEFEENLRLRGEFLLRRFIEGVAFPDDGEGLRRFVSSFVELSDEEMLREIGQIFERPAFWTPFYAECSLSGFQQAIDDTIGALNTGVWRTREGDVIRRLPSWRDVGDPAIRKQLEGVVFALDALRRLFKKRMQEGAIRHCDCEDASCPTFFLDMGVGDELDAIRHDILDAAHRLIPGFAVRIV
ncbi:hypothetical protein [Sphingomonas kyeonggiensis]|uniref:Restriction endonuclease type IV Mrr domain-containing protein n=1 Tax=Sphingomonas kyeonggiensis TaxID=1268553 RepID=A0A7W6NVS4_9SPHN|nr:hypothetical protein [Sphingomonas kyeonggiensis]MBB4097463.1 hypothetical protein [Sphingomonas kyeonggiensis]